MTGTQRTPLCVATLMDPVIDKQAQSKRTINQYALNKWAASALLRPCRALTAEPDRMGSRKNNSMLHSIPNNVGIILEMEILHHLVFMELDCTRGYAQSIGDIFHRFTFCQKP